MEGEGEVPGNSGNVGDSGAGGIPPSEAGGSGIGAGDSSVASTAKEARSMYMPIYVLTGVFGAIFIIGPFLVRRGPNKEIIRCCIMMTAFCMWILWVTVYIAQMNPILGPRIKSDRLLWLLNHEKKTSKAEAKGESSEEPEIPPKVGEDKEKEGGRRTAGTIRSVIKPQRLVRGVSAVPASKEWTVVFQKIPKANGTMYATTRKMASAQGSHDL